MNFIGKSGLAGLLMALAFGAIAQEKHYRFAHDQQLNSGYSVAYDLFSAKLKELSGGKMLVDQYPGAQLGQEPQLLQLVRPAISISPSYRPPILRPSRRRPA